MEVLLRRESSWAELVLRHREFLINHMEPDFGLMEKLNVYGVLSDKDKARFNAENSVYDRSTKLLQCVQAKRRYEHFVEALKSSNQTHVVNYLQKDGNYTFDDDDWPLLDRERWTLRANQETLIDLIEVQDLLILLHAAGVINGRQKDFISSKQTPYEKNEALLDILSQRSIRDYKMTIRCLHETKQSHLAQILEEGKDAVIPKQSAESAETQELKKDTGKIFSGKKTEVHDSALDTDDTSEIVKLLTDDYFLGKGSYGEVYGPIEWRKQTCAVKKSTNMADSITDEIRKSLNTKRDLWTSLSHENLAGIVEVTQSEGRLKADLLIVMEYLAGGTLRKALDNNGSLPIGVVLDWAKQIGAGMAYLHDRNIVHRDLKSSNVLLTESFNPSNVDEKITLKIADFDEMREHDGTVTMTFKGTLGWMAPEVLQTERFSKSSDVWSYGVVVWEMLTGDVPYKNIGVAVLTEKAKSGELALPLPESIPDAFSQLLKYCFRLENTEGRPTSFGKIKEILEQL